ncbi:MAG: hypothetical protein ACJA2S_004968 [Cyclobacteriaceae bacterium]|jgi:hypothetical protein
MDSIIDIDQKAFKTQLSELKDKYKNDSFGFIQDYFINFDHIEIKEDTIKVTRKPGLMNPFRGSGQIVGKLKDSNKSRLKIEYVIKPDVRFSDMLVLISVILGAWLSYTIYSGEIMLSLQGILVGGIFVAFIYINNRIKISSLNSYFQHVLDEIKKGSNKT